MYRIDYRNDSIGSYGVKFVKTVKDVKSFRVYAATHGISILYVMALN